MTSNTDLTPLIAEAGQIELYDRAEQVKSALAARDLTLAIRLCEEATREAHSRAKYNCAPIGPAAHVRQSEAIRAFRAKLRQVRSEVGRDQTGTGNALD